jgi:hypothetical protein
VGSYGIPAGIGLAPLARYFTLLTLGFHDTSFGDHIKLGLHAVAVDEHRRPFVPTFWTIPKGEDPKGRLNKPGSQEPIPMSVAVILTAASQDQALVWMIARVQALTDLEFDVAAIRSNTKPNIGGVVVDSTQGWPVDHLFPHYRAILSPVAIHHGYFGNSKDPTEEHINERVHWSVIAKRGSPAGDLYSPPNLPMNIRPERIAQVTSEERSLLGQDS